MKRALFSAAVGLASLTLASMASANNVGWRGHAAYAVGGAAASDTLGDGLRQGLDLALVVGDFDVTGSRDGFWETRNGPVLGVSSVIGFGSYPSYVSVEVGGSQDTTLAGIAVLGGALVRVDPEVGGGLLARVNADLFLLNVGGKLMGIVAPEPELIGLFTVGLGRF